MAGFRNAQALISSIADGASDRPCRVGGNLDGPTVRNSIPCDCHRPASADLAVLHHRVPVTIEPGDFDRWLDCNDDDAETVMAC